MTNTDLQVKHTCCEEIHSNYRFYPCGKNAKFDRDGKHYCGIHDPVTIAEKCAIKDAAWKADREAKQAISDAAKAKQAEIERRADCYPELLEALQEAEVALSHLQNVMHVRVNPPTLENIQKAILKATKE